MLPFCFLFTGVEKKNDDYRRYFHRKINRWDACTSLLLVEKRQEALRCRDRQPRVYKKVNTCFWFEGGKQESAKKVPRISLGECAEQDDGKMPQVPTTSAAEQCQQKKSIPQSASELKKLKIPELLQLFAHLTGQQLGLAKKPRKPDIISRISEIAILRSE